MKICVRDAFASDGYVKEYRVALSGAQTGDLPSGAQADETDVSAVVTSRYGKVYCHLQCDAVLHTECGRCLAPFALPLHIDVEREVKRCEDGFEDSIVVDGSDCFDLAEEVRAQIYFAFPAKPLCKEDCKGLCPVCGCNLNESSCSCDTKTADPRLAVLKKLIDQN